MILNSNKILIVHDSNDQPPSWCQKLKNEGFTVSIFRSVEDATKAGYKPQIVIFNSKLNGESSIKLIQKFKTQDASIILCSKWGKDKMSFPIWAFDLRVVKSGDYRDLRLTIQEVLEQFKGISNQ